MARTWSNCAAHRCPVPCRGQLLIAACGFLESPDAASESFLPLAVGLQGHHQHWVATDIRRSLELSVGAALLQPVMWGSLAHPSSCPGRRILLAHIWVFCLFRFWIWTASMLKCFLSFINKYSPVRDCSLFNYIHSLKKKGVPDVSGKLWRNSNYL